MASLSTYLANKLTDHSNGVAPYLMPTVWVGLVTSPSSPASPGAEANYTGYARVALAGLMGSAASESATNNGMILFPTCVGLFNVIVGAVTFDAQTGGNMLKFAALATPVNVISGATPKFFANNFTTGLS